MCSDKLTILGRSIIPSLIPPNELHSDVTPAPPSVLSIDEPTTNPPPVAALPTLPIEILEAVIDHASEDKATLQALGTTCHALLPRTRRHLFKKLSSTARHPIVQEAITLATPYLHTLHINMPPARTVPQRTGVLRADEIASIQGARAALCSPLPHISVLEIGTGTGSLSRPADTPGSEVTPLTIHPNIRTSLRVLNLVDPSQILDTPLQIIRFIAQFEGLERLLVQNTRMACPRDINAAYFYHENLLCLAALMGRAPWEAVGMLRAPRSLKSIRISFRGGQRAGGDGDDDGQDNGVPLSGPVGFGWTMLRWLRLSPEVALERFEVLDTMREHELRSFLCYLQSTVASKLKMVAFSFARKASNRVQEALISGWCPAPQSYTVSLPSLRRFCISGLYIGPRPFYPPRSLTEGELAWSPNDFLPRLISAVCFSRLDTAFHARKPGQPERWIDPHYQGLYGPYDPNNVYVEQDGKEDIDEEASTGKVSFGLCITVDVDLDRGAVDASCPPKETEGNEPGPVDDGGEEIDLWPTFRKYRKRPVDVLDLPWDALREVLMTYDRVPVRFVIKPDGHRCASDVFRRKVPGEKEKQDRWMNMMVRYFWKGLGEEVYQKRVGRVWLAVL